MLKRTVTDGIGCVIMANSYDKLKQWVYYSVESFAPEPHGKKYSQRFIIKNVRDDLSICFYSIEGYETLSENTAFEHAYFVIDGFLEVLENSKPKKSKAPEKYFAFVDVGNGIDEIEEDEWIGSDSIKEGLLSFNITYEQLFEERNSISDNDEVIWHNEQRIK